MSFAGYTHIEEYVEAVQLTPDTQDTVVKALNEPAGRLELAKLHVNYNVSEGCYEFVFRYKEDSVDTSLNVTDYLVRLNNGNYAAYSEEEFKKQYINTSIDPIIPAQDTRTMKEALLAVIKQTLPSLNVESADDLTPEILAAVSNGLIAWYDTPNNIFHAKFNDCGLVNFVGLADLMLAFPKANFFNDETKLILEFNNGLFHEGDILCQRNQLNLISLQGLISELKKLPEDVRKLLVGIDMMGMPGSQSAVAPSVDDENFQNWGLMVCGLCPSMGSISKIRR